MIGKAFGQWGIAGKLAAVLVLMLLAQQAYEVFSDNRFIKRIVRIHGGSKLAEGEATLLAFYSTARENAKQRLVSLTREPRFKAVLKLGDRPTLESQLREIVAEQSALAAAFTRIDGTLVASVTRDPRLSVGDLLRRLEPLMKEAGAGNAAAGWAIWSGMTIKGAAVPVEIAGETLGILTLASELDEETLRSLAETTSAGVVLHDRSAILRRSAGIAVNDGQLLAHYEAGRQRQGAENGDPAVLRLEGKNFFTGAEPLQMGPGEELPLVTLLIPADEYLSTSQEFVSDSVLRNSLSLLLTIGLVVTVVARLTRPIRELQLATERLSEGDLAHRVPVSSSDELGQLASAFNTMAARVAGAQRDLAEANASLERQVEERTRSLQEQISRREAAERELQRYAEDLERRVRERTAEIGRALATLDGISDATLILEETNLRLAFANQGAVLQFGLSRDELLSKAYPELINQADAGELASLLDLARRRAPAVVQFTTTHTRTGGEAVTVEVNLQYSSPAGQPACFIAIARDISERRMLEERRNRAQRMEILGTMAGGVAHDLNNALTPISMSIELLRSKHPDEAATLDLLAQCSQRGAAMVRQLLTFARGREGERAPVEGQRLVTEMAQIVRSTFPRSITVEVQSSGDSGTVNGDATQLHQVLLNLCVNARDAMTEGGILRLGVSGVEVPEVFPDCIPESKPGPHVCFSVGDTGPGMVAQVAARIFDPFFTTKSPGTGTGLGLSTVLGIVRSHGGFLRLETAPNRGSRFEVYLPVGKPEAGVRPPERQAVGTVAGQGRRLLLVDDDPFVRESFATVLSRHGFNLTLATDGHDALLKLRAADTPPDLVITDLDMPELGGRGLITALREVLPEVPVIVMSGLVSDEERASLRREYRANAVLDKPVTAAQVLAAIGEAIGSRSPAAS